jgi:hypothetical protein
LFVAGLVEPLGLLGITLKVALNGYVAIDKRVIFVAIEILARVEVTDFDSLRTVDMHLADPGPKPRPELLEITVGVNFVRVFVIDILGRDATNAAKTGDQSR